MTNSKYSAGLMSQSFWAAKEYRALRMTGYIITRVKAIEIN